MHPLQCGIAVFKPCGERMLRRESVVDAHNDDAEISGNAAANVISLFGPAHHQPATVDPKESSRWAAGPLARLVDEHSHCSGRLSRGNVFGVHLHTGCDRANGHPGEH